MSKDLIGTKLEDWPKERADRNRISFQALLDSYIKEISKIEGCGGELAVEKQHSKGRMTARERIKYLIDDNSYFNEIGRFAAYDMYGEYGDINSAGVVVGTADIDKRKCVIVANDATVKAGAYFEVTLKKTLRAQQIAIENKIPIVYLVDSAGVFLPLQDQVFPDEGHFGRIFYNNARISSM